MTLHHTLMPRITLGFVAAAAMTAAACDFSVTNPGPVADGNLDSSTARAALVTGARRSLADILGASPSNGYGLAYWDAAATFEINPGGSTGSFGIPTELQFGRLRAEENSWSSAQEARWVAEDAIRRFKDTGSPEDSLFAAVELWAGYSNRLLGENFCDAVFDGGSKQPFTDFFTRAEGHFNEALRIANAATFKSTENQANVVNAALAGLASVQMEMAYYASDNSKWAAAVANAAPVPNDFTWQMPYYDQDLSQYNAVYWAIGDAPYRAHTEWSTYYEDYYRTTQDARVAWDSTAKTGDAAVAKFAGYPGVVNDRPPFWPEAKYKSRGSPINLSSGWEMRLIEAEYELAVNNSAANAVAKMNIRRQNLSLPDLTVGTVAEAWTDLKRERMMELWLEARRLGDLRRWSTSGTAGFGMGQTFDGVWVTGESTPRETMTDPTTRDLCWPIGRNETQTNPNVSP